MRSRHHTESATRPFDGQLAPLIHFEVFIDGKSVILQCNFSPVRHFRLFEGGTLVKTVLASHVHDVHQDPNSSTQILMSLDFTGSSMTLNKKKLAELGSTLTLKVDTTSVNERDRLWQFLKALVDDDYELACQQYHWPAVPTLKEGAAKKKGKRIGSQSVWVVLHPNRLLLYKKQSDEIPVNVMLLTEVNVESLGDASIVMHIRSRPCELSFSSAQEAEEWRIAICCEIDLTTQLRPLNLPKRLAKPKTASISTKFDLSGVFDDSNPNACGLPGCLNLKETGIDFCLKHANLQAKKIEKEEAAKRELEQKVQEEEEQLRIKLLDEAINNPIFWKVAIEAEGGERFYYNQAAKVSQYARPLCLIQQDKLEVTQWTEMKDPEGRRAWHNLKTGVTSKTRPECLGRDPIMAHWKEALSETGEKYWYNKQLMQSTYENPFLEELKRQERELLEAPACPPMKPIKHQGEANLKALLEEQQSTILDLSAQVAKGQLQLQELTKQLDAPPPPYVAESQATISNLTKELSDAQAIIRQLNTEMAQVRATNQQLEKKVGEQQQTIIHLQKQLDAVPQTSPPAHRRQISVTVTQKLNESQAMIAALQAQLAEAQKSPRSSDIRPPPRDEPRVSTGDERAGEAALNSRLDRLEEQNRQLMTLLQSQNQAKPLVAPTREPPARPAPRAKIER